MDGIFPVQFWDLVFSYNSKEERDHKIKGDNSVMKKGWTRLNLEKGRGGRKNQRQKWKSRPRAQTEGEISQLPVSGGAE
ncbi:hypothetical protein SKAU_G00130310 [Synaphobranchus kaupii]|uniref:Uncharacterized protein n=1 Tax=Synaphobranchus kaupii TaxID=118154 RepID=A0A9Q1FQY4_SYNKA|nr:hypothetical protein SKAU_G00130310 [Synaphobranchus kaupii]